METETVKQDEKELTIEESFSRLEEIMTAMQDSALTLDDSIRFYSEGMEILKKCREKIDLAEKKVKVLNEEGNWDAF